MSVFDIVVGQQRAVATMTRALEDAQKARLGEKSAGFNHAWLITGPAGSGRSTLALAFSAALVCKNNGCGTCDACRLAVAGVHPDVEHVVPGKVQYTAEEADHLVERSVLNPVESPWHIIVVEDVDRFNLTAVPKLLKGIEEPPPHTLWLFCAPTRDDVPDAIASRCRSLVLETPKNSDVAHELTNRFGVDPAMAAFAARAAQGHFGRARALATDEACRIRRKDVLEIPSRLRHIGSSYEFAARVIKSAEEEAQLAGKPLGDQLLANVKMIYGEGAEGKGLRGGAKGMAKAVKDAEDETKKRIRRLTFDEYDRTLMDLTGFYRDVLVVLAGATQELINEEMRPRVDEVADQLTATQVLICIDAINETRDNIIANVNPSIAFESLFVTLLNPQ